MDQDALIEQITREVYAKLNIHAAPKAAVRVKSVSELANTLEYSMLNPDTTRAQIKAALDVTKKLRIASICVSPYYAAYAAEYLQNTGIAVCVPVGFPHGAASTAAKTVEIREAVKNGATELDVEPNILAIKSGDWNSARKDLEELVNLARGKAKFKVIYEQGLMSDEEKVSALKLMRDCGVDFVKISNALTGKNACIEDVRFVRSILGSHIGIKIDGGVRSAEIASRLIDAGADRFGVSKPADVLAGAMR